MTSKFLLLSSVALCLTFEAAPAMAQSQSQVRPSTDPDDVIVVARKRQESILNVPVVETVVSQEKLEKYVINDVFSPTVEALARASAIVDASARTAAEAVGADDRVLDRRSLKRAERLLARHRRSTR